MEPKRSENLYNIRYTINKKDIPAFVNELRGMQEDMIEAVVEAKGRQGYPEARAVIDYIRSLK